MSLNVHLKTQCNFSFGCELTRVDPEEASGAAKVLPGECWILLEVTDENVI